MNTITLKSQSEKGDTFQTTIHPSEGMKFSSFLINDHELLPKPIRLIGPHYSNRKPHFIQYPDLFPHQSEHPDPLHHGISRYVWWNVIDSNSTSITATLTGKDTFEGHTLEKLQGQNFTMKMEVNLLPTGLKILLSIVSDTDSLIGLQIPVNSPLIHAKVRPTPTTKNLAINSQNVLSLPIEGNLDYTFHLGNNPQKGEVKWKTKDFEMITCYKADSEENCWRLTKNNEKSIAYFEAISSQDPWHPNLTASRMQFYTQIT